MRKHIISAVKLKLLFTCLLALLPLAACGGNGDEIASPQYTLDDLLDITRERRLNITANRPTHEQLLELTRGRESPTTDMMYDMWQLILYSSDNTGQPITAAKAIEDIELFFVAMRLIYGPYIYFGAILFLHQYLMKSLRKSQLLIRFRLFSLKISYITH